MNSNCQNDASKTIWIQIVKNDASKTIWTTSYSVEKKYLKIGLLSSIFFSQLVTIDANLTFFGYQSNQTLEVWTSADILVYNGAINDGC